MNSGKKKKKKEVQSFGQRDGVTALYRQLESPPSLSRLEIVFP